MSCNAGLLVIIVILVILFIIYYFKHGNNQLIHNKGTIDEILDNTKNKRIELSQSSILPATSTTPTSYAPYVPYESPVGKHNPPSVDQNANDVMSDNVINDLINRYKNKKMPLDKKNIDPTLASDSEPEPDDPSFNIHGDFGDFIPNENVNDPLSDTNSDDSRNFTYNKKNFTLRSVDDIADQFDAQKMLPKVIEKGWFDVDPLMCTKKIKGTSLIHPKMHMGVNTTGSSHKYSSHDPRGDVPIPKQNIGPFRNSTIEPDTNIKGFCN